jgi:hypothetical protein
VDINDSGDISFPEFCVWLIHQLGPRLMQKISDSVQSSAQAIVSSPEASKGANTWQAVHSASPSLLQAQDKSPSLSTPPPHSAAVVNAAAGNETSPSSSYFALQVSYLCSPALALVLMFCSHLHSFTHGRSASIMSAARRPWLDASVTFAVGQSCSALLVAVSTCTLYAGHMPRHH